MLKGFQIATRRIAVLANQNEPPTVSSNESESVPVVDSISKRPILELSGTIYFLQFSKFRIRPDLGSNVEPILQDPFESQLGI